MRSWLACAAFGVVSLQAILARADVPADSVEIKLKTPIEPEFASEDMDETKFRDPGTDVIARQFNLARCVCDEGGQTQNVVFNATWKSVPPSPAGTKLFAWVGADCKGVTNRDDRLKKCSSLTAIEDAATLSDGETKFVGVGTLLTPGTDNATCKEDVTGVAYGLYTSGDTEATITEVGHVDIKVDMNTPPLPTTVTVAAQEGQIALSWEAVASDAGDIQYFQALCSRRDGAAVHVDPTHEAQYDTVDSLCELPYTTELAALMIKNDAELDGDPIALGDVPASLKALKHAFVCGQSPGGATKGIELKGLFNDVEYVVVLVSVDKAGNPTAAYVPRVISPQPGGDFWGGVSQDNAQVEGGLCRIESPFGGGAGGGGLYGALRAWRDDLETTAAGRWLVDRYYAWGAPLAAAARGSLAVRVLVGAALVPMIAVALAWHTLGLPLLLALLGLAVWWRRRAPARRVRLAVAGALLLAPSLAAAQSNTPYWDDAMATSTEVSTGPAWHLGVRLGPFLPGIDDERLPTKPYARMFGDGTWMPSLDVHRLFGTRFGQLGIGGSVGYFSKTADAWQPGSDTERASGNDTSLKILPFELTAIYRASQLDDNWGIPVVPYARGGLAYSLWWVRRPAGDLSKSCVEGGMTISPCDRGIGGSLGLVGAVGLAVRAERIDPDAARSMRDSGLEHAGFYAEAAASWVDGFGSAKKLSLGDTTWSAGIDFEF